MEKEMLAMARFKQGEGIFEKFMGWMQSEEGMGVRKSVAHVEKLCPFQTRSTQRRRLERVCFGSKPYSQGYFRRMHRKREPLGDHFRSIVKN